LITSFSQSLYGIAGPTLKRNTFSFFAKETKDARTSWLREKCGKKIGPSGI
jgi:hypothetical protein